MTQLLVWVGFLVFIATLVALDLGVFHRRHRVVRLAAVRLMVVRHDNLTPDRNLLVRLARRFYPVTDDLESGRFFVRRDGRRAMTPLFLTLLLIESSDVLFAVDSIPAIFAITGDPFLVFTSNVFAILGLRSLYFALAGLMDRFRYLKTSLVFLLAYVGVKTMQSHSHLSGRPFCSSASG